MLPQLRHRCLAGAWGDNSPKIDQVILYHQSFTSRARHESPLRTDNTALDRRDKHLLPSDQLTNRHQTVSKPNAMDSAALSPSLEQPVTTTRFSL